MHGKFDPRLPWPGSGDVEVRGPFEADGDETAAVIHFVIVQPGEGSNAPADQTVTAIGQGTWSAPDTEWSGMVHRTGRLPLGGTAPLHPGPARGIGLAIAVKPEKLTDDRPPRYDAPSFQALTWCADFEFVASEAAT